MLAVVVVPWCPCRGGAPAPAPAPAQRIVPSSPVRTPRDQLDSSMTGQRISLMSSKGSAQQLDNSNDRWSCHDREGHF
jgi:hypothetical protein